MRAGGKVAREPGPVKGGKTVIAFVEDPTGYKWELIQRQPPIPEPIAQVGSWALNRNPWCSISWGPVIRSLSQP